MTRICSVIGCLLIASAAYAQQAADPYNQEGVRETPATGRHPLQASPKDDTQLKADALTFAIQQRNGALDSLLQCQASTARQIEMLQQKINELSKSPPGAK